MRFKNPQLRRRNQPWYSSWDDAKSRCKDKTNKHYGGRGIKFDIPFWYCGVLYWRDKAYLMKQHSIDRIDNDGDYVFANCRFIEKAENIRRSATGNKYNLGRKHSLEIRRKMSEAQKGKKLPIEQRRKISLSLIGNKRGTGNDPWKNRRKR